MFVTLLLAASLSAPVPKSLKTRPAFDGAWRVTEVHHNGLTVSGDNRVWVIAGEALTKEPAINRPITFSLRLRPDVSPHAIDYILREPGVDDETRACWFTVEGDALKLCWSLDGSGRPDNDITGDGRTLLVLERVKDRKK